MKYLRLLLIVGATLLSSTVWARERERPFNRANRRYGVVCGRGGILR
jgi:hypothetical protein